MTQDIYDIRTDQEAILGDLRPDTRLLIRILLSKKKDDLLEGVKEWQLSKEENHVSVPAR